MLLYCTVEELKFLFAGIYLTTVMSMTSLSVILAVLTSNINHRGQKEAGVPRWLSTILTLLSRMMCMDIVFLKPKRRTYTEYPTTNKVSQQKPYHYISAAVSGDSGCLIDYENGDTHAQVRNACAASHKNHVTHQSNKTIEENKDLTLILDKLDDLISKEAERDKADMVIKQWIEVAEIVDRFFFWLFVLGTLFASLFLLVIYPLFKKNIIEIS